MTTIIEKFLQAGRELVAIKSPAEFKENYQRIVVLLNLSEKFFSEEMLTAKEISQILLKKYRCKVTPQAVRSASLGKQAKNKIGVLLRDKVVHYHLLHGGIKLAQSLTGDGDTSVSSETVIPHEIVDSQPGYIKKVVYQINGCYDGHYFDACFVMIRRLIETLIIEVYEKKGIAGEIKGSDGKLFMFDNLVKKVISDGRIVLGRSTKTNLRKLKEFGDIAAHNRRFNVKKHDVDKYSDVIRIASEELINNFP